MKRVDGRKVDQLRELRLTTDVFEYAAGSVLFEIGKTKILCAVTLSESVPHFLRGKGNGWLTAEYALLPASTITRSSRESSSFRRNGRSLDGLILGNEYGHLRELPAFRNHALFPARPVLGAHPNAPRRPHPQVPVLSARILKRSGHPGASTLAVARTGARDLDEPMGRTRRGGRNSLRWCLVARAAGGKGELALRA